MTKTIICLPFFCLFILMSCGEGVLDPSNPERNSVVIQRPEALTAYEQIQIRQEVKKEATLKNMKTEDKQIFLDLNKAIADKDKEKEFEIRTKIQRLEDTKSKELEDAIKKGDDEKAKTLRK